jgi:regulator of protease activity HflC (stomatin/prohibitin superfamily)
MRQYSHQPVSADSHDIRKRWSLLGILVLVLLYWFLARQVERIDLGAWQWWQARAVAFPLLQTLTPLITFTAEMLSWRVWRHFLPFVVGIWLARSLTVSLVHLLYDLPARADAAQFLKRLQTREAGEPALYLDRRNFNELRQKSPVLRLGGPGRVIVDKGDVAVTELNGRFHRILPTGIHSLARFEQVRGVLDLRSQEREQAGVSLVTRDGIELKTDVGVTFRIIPGEEPSTKSRPFPFDRDAVRRAAYAETVLIDGAISTWESVVLGIVGDGLQQTVAGYRLDELINPDNPSANPHVALKSELEEQARPIARQAGIEILQIRLGRLEAPETVTNQRIRYWQAFWEKERRISEADGTAEAMAEEEMARAEAESEMLHAIVEGINQAQLENQHTSSRELVAIRLIEILERLAHNSQQISPLPADLLPQLHDLNRQLLLEVTPEADAENNGVADEEG